MATKTILKNTTTTAPEKAEELEKISSENVAVKKETIAITKPDSKSTEATEKDNKINGTKFAKDQADSNVKHLQQNNIGMASFKLSQQTQMELKDTIAKMLQKGKGILAADDTIESMGVRLGACGLHNSEENRRRYRQLLFTTPNLGKHISAVILHDDTFCQSTDKGERFVDFLKRQGIVAGINIDGGLAPLCPMEEEGGHGETITQGLDNLAGRAAKYKAGGCSFAKWRCAYRISDTTPSIMALEQNAIVMARYAMICQRIGLVPIVEPDVSCDGHHSIQQCQRATQQVLAHVFKALAEHAIYLEGIVIKMNMVTSGLKAGVQASPEKVAEETLVTLRRTIPMAVSVIAFLSGGMTEFVATENLSAINKLAGPTGSDTKPWQLTFCFGRALQANVMEIWHGESENVGAAQKQFLLRSRANADAEEGKYEGEKAILAALSGVNFLGSVPSRYY